MSNYQLCDTYFAVKCYKRKKASLSKRLSVDPTGLEPVTP